MSPVPSRRALAVLNSAPWIDFTTMPKEGVRYYVSLVEGVLATARRGADRPLQSALGAPPGRAEIDAALGAAVAASDEVTARYFAEGDKKVACHQGCDHCCHQPVPVLFPEAVRALDALAPEARAGVGERAWAALGALGGLDLYEAWEVRHPCPLLVDGRCAAYTARPSACAAYYSASDEACAGDADASVPRHGPPLMAAASARAALADALAAAGLDARSVWLGSALAALADDPSLAERWLTGAKLPEHLVPDRHGRIVAFRRRRPP